MRRRLRFAVPVLLAVAVAVALAGAQDGAERSASQSRATFRAGDGTARAQSPITFRGDYETGDRSQWSDCHVQNASRCTVVRRPVRQGRYAGRFTVSAADQPGGTERAENVAQLGDTLGSNRYYAWSTMFPRGFRTPSWANFRQFGGGNTGITGCVQEHFYASYDPPSNGPADAVFLEICAGDVTSGRMPRKRVFKVHDHLNLGRWNDYVLHVRWSHRRAEGFLSVWHRVAGRPWRRAIRYRGPTAQFQRGQRVRIATSEGLYRSGTTRRATVYHDGFVSGRSFSAVAAAAFGG